MIPNPNKRKGSENRQPTGDRERNVGHPNGEEHSRVPKGNRGVRRIDGFGEIALEIPTLETPTIGDSVGLVVVTVLIVGVVLDDASGVGVVDDALLIPLGLLWWDHATAVYGQEEIRYERQ